MSDKILGYRLSISEIPAKVHCAPLKAFKHLLAVYKIYKYQRKGRRLKHLYPDPVFQTSLDPNPVCLERLDPDPETS